jgi:hypothetical protein
MVFGSYEKLPVFLKEKSQIAANDEWEAASEAGRV